MLTLGTPAAARTEGLLRAILETETDAFVTIPCAEALARYSADTDATEELARLAGPGHPGPVRIEALNALTQLDPDTLHPHHHVVARQPTTKTSTCAERASISSSRSKAPTPPRRWSSGGTNSACTRRISQRSIPGSLRTTLPRAAARCIDLKRC